MYDCIIIGTGPAGLSAAINLKTYNKNFVWFGSGTLSDKVRKAEKIVNYPGFPEISGQGLFEKFKEHIDAAGIEITEKTVNINMSRTINPKDCISPCGITIGRKSARQTPKTSARIQINIIQPPSRPPWRIYC